MKKVLVILGLTLLVSIMGVVSAEEYVDLTDSNLKVIEHASGAETSGEMTISYNVGSNKYRVYIPPSFVFTSTQTTVVSKVNATDVVITHGSELFVNIKSTHNWKLQPHDNVGDEIEESHSEMIYSVSTSSQKEGGTWIQITENPTRILSVPSSTGTEPATGEVYLKFELSSIEGATLNAIYKDLVTFNVGVTTPSPSPSPSP